VGNTALLVSEEEQPRMINEVVEVSAVDSCSAPSQTGYQNLKVDGNTNTGGNLDENTERCQSNLGNSDRFLLASSRDINP
jgi:hypothetical protein